MNSGMLNEHDAQRGAESKGEFLGMTGNSAWYLLGSSGASVLLVIVLWGMLGFSLVICLLLGLILCGLSVAYVFALKNNKPAHYDSDFFESALVEAGVVSLAFGPRSVRPRNPFRDGSVMDEPVNAASKPVPTKLTRRESLPARRAEATNVADSAPATRTETPRAKRRSEEVPVVPLAAHERLQQELNTATDLLDDAIAEHEEDLS
ncbi:MAG: DUF4133 domain-containing protein [Opitutus sp.]